MSQTVVREKCMEVPKKLLHQVITDFEGYPSFLSEVVGAKRDPKSPKNKPRVTFELEIMKRFEYTLEYDIGEDEISWHFVKSNFFKSNDGKWVLRETGAGKTEARYELAISFGFLVPGWVSRKLTEVSLPKMLDNFEARAKQIAS